MLTFCSSTEVVGYGAQRLPPDHPGHPGNMTNGEAGDGDADGEPETPVGLGIGMANVAARRASGISLTMPQRRTSGVIIPR